MNVILHGSDTMQFDQLKLREFMTLLRGSVVCRSRHGRSSGRGS
jgi:hypothetical protein